MHDASFLPPQNAETKLNRKPWRDTRREGLQTSDRLHLHILDENERQLGGQNGQCALQRQKLAFSTERQGDAFKAFFRFGWQDLTTADLQTSSREDFSNALLRGIACLRGILRRRIDILLTRLAGVVQQ